MNNEFCVTIGTDLKEQDICNTEKFSYACVVDLRRCVNNGPFPIEETTVRKLANFRVDYEQVPMSLYSANSRAENELFRTLTEHQGNVLVLTDEPVPMARFCQQLDIPFSSSDLYIVETADDYMPVQVAQKAATPAQFGTFGA